MCDAQTAGVQRLEVTTGLGLNDYTVNIALGSFVVCRDIKNIICEEEEGAGNLPYLGSA